MPDSTASAPLLEVCGVGKRFPGVVALRDVSLHLNEGEVLSVIGENGAGKSTLMKILAGVQPPDGGEIRIDGKAVNIGSVHEALSAGVALIHQELNLAGNLDVASNIFLGREPGTAGWIDQRSIRERAKKYLKMVGLEVSPDVIVETLPIGKQQMVEIAKALSVNARILIMDEPTSSLSQAEAEQLFVVIRDLRSKGVSIIYISHRLGEVKELSDRVEVLRDGENAGQLRREEINHDAMVQLMVGRDISQFYQAAEKTPGDVVLEACGVRSAMYPEHAVSFQLRRGEIVGVAGLVGAGRTELLEAIFGATPAVGGVIKIKGSAIRVSSPLDAIRAGVALVPEDRKSQGLILPMSVKDNISLASLRRDMKMGMRNAARESELSAEMIGLMNVKTPNERQIVGFLSGGNQQKVVLGKWMALNPDVLLLDEPTRGIDVGAKQEIYGLMENLAKEGNAILFVSSEMEEVLGMADRVLVMHEGRLTGELQRDELSEEAIMQLATGGEAVSAA